MLLILTHTFYFITASTVFDSFEQRTESHCLYTFFLVQVDVSVVLSKDKVLNINDLSQR